MLLRSTALSAAIALAFVGSLSARAQVRHDEPAWQAFIAAAGSDPKQAQAALADIAARWRNNYAAMIVDVARFLPSPRTNQAADERTPLDVDDAVDERRPGAIQGRGDAPSTVRSSPGADTRRRLTTFLERQTRQRFGDDLRAWRKWMWALPDHPHADYASFKAELYSRIDPRFRAFFLCMANSKISEHSLLESRSCEDPALQRGGQGVRRHRARTRPASVRASGRSGGSRTVVGCITRQGPREAVGPQRIHCSVLRIRHSQSQRAQKRARSHGNAGIPGIRGDLQSVSYRF